MGPARMESLVGYAATGLLSLLILALPQAWGQAPASPPGTPITSRPELVLQTGHSRTVYALCFSPDGRWLATGGGDRTIKLWDARSGGQLRMLLGHTSDVTSLAVSSDGRWLASGSEDKTVKLWDVENGKLLRTFTGFTQPVSRVAFGADGKVLLAAGQDGTIRGWSPADGKLSFTLRGPGAAAAAWVIGPNADWLLTVDEENRPASWALPAGTRTRLDPPVGKMMPDWAFSADAGRLALAADTKIVMWDNQSGKILWSVDANARGLSTSPLLFTADGSRLLSITDKGVAEFRDSASGRLATSFPVTAGGEEELVSAVAVSPDGSVLAVANQDFSISLWRIASGKPLARLQGASPEWEKSVAFSADGRWMSTGSPEQSVGLWEAATGRLVGTIASKDRGIFLTALSADGRRLASGSLSGEVRLWDAATGKMLSSLNPPDKEAVAADSAKIGLALSPDGHWLAAQDGYMVVQVWDTASGRLAFTLEGGTPESNNRTGISSLAFSRDSRWLAQASGGKATVKLWDLTTGRKRALPASAIWAVAFSPDGRQVATGGYDHQVKIWNAATGALLHVMAGHSEPVQAVAFSADGSVLASGGDDMMVRLWDASSGKLLHLLRGHTAEVRKLAFGAEGGWLASVSADGTTRIWDVRSGELLATLVTLEGTNWMVATPDGYFDGTAGAWDRILWRFSQKTFDVAPAEVFFNEFYDPGILGELLSGKRPKAPRNLSQLDRRQAEVKLALEGGQAAGAAVAERRVKVAVEVQEAPADQQHPAGSGAQDVRLFRNGSLVKMWHGEMKLDKDGKATLEAEVTLVAGENKLTAYAFNHDNIKSPDAALTVTGADSLKRQGTAHILAMGINQYADSDFNLRYAAADAQDFAQEIEAQQKKLGKYAKVEITSLQDQQATKANLLGALQYLAEVAQPEDAVFIYYAGHGTAAGARFYLIPHDLGYAGGRDELDDAAVKSVLAHSVSDLELDQAFEGIDAGELVLVIDACRSGQALQADDPRQGPMNSKGLAQLAYEKGMYILTASQGYQAALEASSYGHGLLTYALVEEGLRSAKSDNEPKDGEITLREWLDYASQEVPQLELQLMQAARTRGMDVAIVEGEQKIEELEKRSLQRPRVFYRREPEATPFVVAKP
jgi:WD40 repeat protein